MGQDYPYNDKDSFAIPFMRKCVKLVWQLLEFEETNETEIGISKEMLFRPLSTVVQKVINANPRLKLTNEFI